MKSLFLDDEQCQLLREMLDFVPLTPRYIGLVVDLLGRIPESAASPDTRAEGTQPAPDLHRETGGGFTLTAVTPKGVAMLESLDRMLRNGQ